MAEGRLSTRAAKAADEPAVLQLLQHIQCDLCQIACG